MSKLCPVSHRIGLLLGTGKGADVHFLVGRDEVKEHLSAHKLILAASSEVFEAMFRFDELNETRPPVKKVAKMANSAVDDAAARGTLIIPSSNFSVPIRERWPTPSDC
ncbi:hypothetical protein niasHS_004310 [Heterodera schachtii]|uniref:BTB domain-containing protein n=1 Tax=Heterodera schachtii TaxID=97005 RepID=A0ABD2JV34_HETSC